MNSYLVPFSAPLTYSSDSTASLSQARPCSGWLSLSSMVLFALVAPEFFGLCTDSVWGMRKACAECFLAVVHNTSPEVCRAKLWPLFITLISDPCRWVSVATLGPRRGLRTCHCVLCLFSNGPAYLDFVRIIRGPEISEAWSVGCKQIFQK